MAVDIRATTICSLGTIIQGSISDESVSPGQGLIRCRGQLIIDGMINPATGTIVQLAYVHENRIIRIPRRLRVISHFADPFRNQTTVQIGDKLVWLSDKGPNPLDRIPEPAFPSDAQPGDTFTQELPYPDPLSEDPTTLTQKEYTYNGLCWQETITPVTGFNFSKGDVTAAEQNPDRPADEEFRAPTTISAITIASKCLAGLSIAGAGITQLALHYKQNEITINTYVSTLEQLLADESLVGYLDANEVLRVKQLALLSGGEGPQIDEDSLIDLGPLGFGDIPANEEIEVDETTKKDEQELNPDPQPVQAFSIVYNTSSIAVTLTTASILQHVKYDYFRSSFGKLKVTILENTVSSAYLIQNGDVYQLVLQDSDTYSGSVQYEVTDGVTTDSNVITLVRYQPPDDSPPDSVPGDFFLDNSAPVGNTGGTASGSTVGSAIETAIPYTNTQGVAVVTTYTGIPSSFYEEVYGQYNEVLYRREVSTINAAAVASNVFKLYLENGFLPSDYDVSVVTITNFVYDYGFENSFYQDSEKVFNENTVLNQSKTCKIGETCQSGIEVPENPAVGDTFVFGECKYVFDGVNWNPAENDGAGLKTEQEPPIPSIKDVIASSAPVLLQQITSVYESYHHIVGAINWPSNIDYLPPLYSGDALVEETVQTFTRQQELVNTVTVRDVSRTDTSVYRARYKTVEGQQFLASISENVNTVASTLGVFNYSKRLVADGGETVLRRDREYGLQQRASLPQKNELTKTGGDAQGATDETLTGGYSAQVDRTGTEASSVPKPVYTPSMPRTWDAENGYQELRDVWAELNDKVLKLRYQRAYRQLAYGNRYGMSLQLAPWALPMYPLNPIYLNLQSVVGAYASNGLSIAFNAEGIIANIDALLIGGVGGTGTPYFPVANDIALPAAPAPDINPAYVPPNSVAVPGGFDPNDPSAIWATLPTTDAESFSQSLTPDYVYPSAPTTIKAALGVRVGLAFLRYNYSLDSGTYTQTLGITTGITARREISVTVPGLTIQVQLGAVTVSLGAAVRPPVKNLTVLAGTPAVSTGASFVVPAADIAVAAAPGPIVPRPAITFTPPAVDIAVAAGVPAVVGGASVAVPTATITIAGAAPAVTIVSQPVFSALLYTGTGASLSVTGTGFEPGVVWTKRRTVATGEHTFYDYARGTTKYWRISSSTQVTNSESLTAFDSNGFTVGTNAISNTNTASYVAYCIKKGSTGASNTNGTITSTVYANTTAGVNIFTYTGNGTNGATVGHGLGSTPEFVFLSNLTGGYGIAAGGNFLSTNEYMLLSGSLGRTSSAALLQNYSSTTITLGTNGSVNLNASSYVGYAFASVTGNSKIGTYTGSGASDQAITTGFTPSFVMIKAYSTSGDWLIFDSARGVTKQLVANTTAVESTVDKVTFDANGFTVKASQNNNTSSVSYVYLAFR